MIFALPGLYILLTLSQPEPPTLMRLYLTCAILAVFGLYAPNLFVRAKADRRRQEIINGFPDCLYLMLVCVEAGLGLAAALDRVGREMVSSHPRISALLTAPTLLIRAGAHRGGAKRKTAQRSRDDA